MERVASVHVLKAVVGFVLAMAWLMTSAQTSPPRDPRLAPAPAYFMKNNTLGFGVPVPTFSTPELASQYVAATHLTWAWPHPHGGAPLYCPAQVPTFTRAEFASGSPPSYASSETPFKIIRRQTANCWSWNGNVCADFSCRDDPTEFHYNMRADCPPDRVFAAGGRCECPAGQELTRNAAGEWRCAVPETCSLLNRAACRDASCPAANAVLPGIAAKVQTEVDYEGAGAHPLSFTRSFRSHGARPYVEPGAWSHWVHNWARRIDVYPEAGYRGRAYVIREDASQRTYATDGAGTWATEQLGDRNTLTEQRDTTTGARTGFQYKLWADDSIEHYDPAGRLLRVVQRNGWTHTLTYSDATTPASVAPRAGLLVSVRNHFGRELRFTYDAAGRLAELLPPGAVSGTAPGSAASPIRYVHNEPAGLGSGVPALNQPTSVVWQDGHVRRYHYENTQFPQWLTGRTDELGVRIGTYTYNTSGQLVRSAGPNGLNVVDFAYSGNTTQVTDHSGAAPVTSVYTYEAVAGAVRPVSVSAPCSQCSSTSVRTAYTSAGDVARRVEHDGRITFFTYDAKGRETERATYPAAYNTATTRPALNLAERVVSTRWHSTWNLPTQVAEPLKNTAYTYGTGGRLTGESWAATTDATGAAKFNAVKTGSTFATGWGYNASVLPSSIVDRIDGVEARRWAFTYGSSGTPTKLTTTESGATTTATLTTSTQHGFLTGLSSTTGSSAQFTFDLRGKIRTAQLPDWNATFEHDARSLLQEVRFGTGAWIRLAYDASGVPIRIEDSGGLSQPIAALKDLESKVSESRISLASRLAGAASAWRAGSLRSRLDEWLPLPSARAQAPPVPPPVWLTELLGLSRAAPAAMPGFDGAPAPAGSCCGESVQTQARALEQAIRRVTAPVVLMGTVAAQVGQQIADDLLLLRARSKLRKNMLCNKTTPIPSGCHEAHHIVAFLARDAQEARDILALEAVNIDIDSPLNGVWVPCAQHRRMHGPLYYGKVNLALRILPVKNTATVAAELRSIAAQIQAGTF